MTYENYGVQNNDDEIFITVTVSTPGIAQTDVEKYSVDGSNIHITDSPNATGIIPKTLLGTGKELIGSLIEIDTDVLLDLIPKEDWSTCFDNLVIKYYFEGGKAGQIQPFLCLPTDKHKSVSGKTIGAEKFVKITI